MLPILIAHRGASADRPEHTLAAYRLAIHEGADFIEPDLVPTKDGVLVARHENNIAGTTNVAAFPQFAGRHTTKKIDGKKVTGWFTEDFTLAELKKLRARERLPGLRPQNTAFLDEEIPTLDEILSLAREEGGKRSRVVGVYPETKHPSYFRGIGLPLEETLLATLAAHGLENATDRVFLQSFEVGNLRWLHEHSPLPLVQLLSLFGHPADQPRLRYHAMCTRRGLTEVARYARAIGPDKKMLKRCLGGRPKATLVERAHRAGLLVHPWAFRPENAFLPKRLRLPGGKSTRGKAEAEIEQYLRLGIDGLFSDSTEVARRAIERFSGERFSGNA